MRTQSRELVLGRSLSEFMRTLDIYSTSGGSRGDRTRLRNQMRRLSNAHVQLVYKDKHAIGPEPSRARSGKADPLEWTQDSSNLGSTPLVITIFGYSASDSDQDAGSPPEVGMFPAGPPL